MLVHAAAEHNAIGANFPTKEEIRLTGQRIQVEGPTTQHKVISKSKNLKLKKTKNGKAVGLKVCRTGAVSIVSSFSFRACAD